jgi:hypothetical protein
MNVSAPAPRGGEEGGARGGEPGAWAGQEGLQLPVVREAADRGPTQAQTSRLLTPWHPHRWLGCPFNYSLSFSMGFVFRSQKRQEFKPAFCLPHTET